jgi:CubicO group peptidase (beta-lactamase class C family)
MFDPTLVKWSAAVGRTVSANSYSLEGYTVPLIFEPGNGWAYGVGLDWVGHLVSVLANSTFEAYLEKHVFGPLGMSSTTFRLAERPELAQRRAAVALRAEPRGALSSGGSDPVPEHPPMESGGSGLFSTANDYSKLLGALIEGGDGILKLESIRELCEPQLPDNKYLMANFESPFHDVFCCEYPRETQANYGLGGAINVEDIPGKRRKGSIMWSGMSNPHWVNLPLNALFGETHR